MPPPSSVQARRRSEGESGESDATSSASVELAPSSRHSVVPSLPIPVRRPPRKLTLEQRAKQIEHRLGRHPSEFRRQYDRAFEMSWIYHDNALEGAVYTFEELSAAFRQEEVTVVDSNVMPIYDAIRRDKTAIALLRDTATRKRVPLTVDLIRKLYCILHPEEGDPKAVKYRRDIPQHRLYFHEYAAPDRIAYRVRQVVDWLNDPETRKNVSTLRASAKAHYELARTYPFPHDSGKVARLFMNLLLMRGGLPPAVIHAAERQRYYESLKHPSPGMLLQIVRDAVDNSLGSVEKLLDETETHKRSFVN
jgi:Fic family protein